MAERRPLVIVGSEVVELPSGDTLPGGGGGGSGTVTSVGLSVPTGFSVSGSPVTTTGAFTISYAGGYQGYTSAESSKLAGIQAGATVGAVWGSNLSAVPTIISAFGSLSNSSGWLRNNGSGTLSYTSPTKADVGLGNVDNTSDATKVVASAAILQTGRTIQTNLGSTSAATFDGSTNISPGVTGTLPIANGGTGGTTSAAARTNLGLGTAATYGTGTTGALVPLCDTAPRFFGVYIGTEGHYIYNATAGLGVRVTNSGPYFKFGTDGDFTAANGRVGSGRLFLSGTSTTAGLYDATYSKWLITNDAGANAIRFNGGCSPTTDGSFNFGQATFRWNQVFAVSGTINTSDAREKTPVRELTTAELAAAVALSNEIGVYQWLNMIDEKGADVARLHIGMTVQRAIEIMEAHGLDPYRYGFICYDEWQEQQAVTVSVPRVLDSDGNEVSPAHESVVQPHLHAGNRYGFRMSELLAFCLAGEAHARSIMEQRLTALELAVNAASSK